jgi:hypothetical protein
MHKIISTAVLVLALATGGSATVLGGTALASTGAGHGIATAPAPAATPAPTGGGSPSGAWVILGVIVLFGAGLTVAKIRR